MRMIGHLATENNARLFGDFLCVQGIDNQIEFETGTGWAVWIRDEDKISDAQKHFTLFRANPADPSFADHARGANLKREQQTKDDEAYRKRVIQGRRFFGSLTGFGFGPVSFALIFISVGVAILTGFGKDFNPVASLFMSQYEGHDLLEVKQGQVWRLVTPIFLHFGPLHVLFNMLWLADLGSMIEARKSSWFLLVEVLVIAALSNLAQYFATGPMFGGMSGVVYGLFGYVWMRSKFDPGSGFFIHPTTVTIMLIWLVACFTGLVGAVANTAHTVGFLVGVLWGYAASVRRA
jgi:GlpG protein